MTWEKAREQNPRQWVVIEALSWQDEGETRLVTDVTVLMRFGEDSRSAQRYANDLLAAMPERQFYSTYTGWETPRIKIPVRRVKTPRSYADNRQPTIVSKAVRNSGS